MRPRRRVAVHCTLTVSARLMRSEGSASRQATSAGVALPATSTSRSISPRRSRVVVYQPAGTSSRWTTAASAIGTDPGAVGGGRPSKVAPCPVARSSS